MEQFKKHQTKLIIAAIVVIFFSRVIDLQYEI